MRLSAPCARAARSLTSLLLLMLAVPAVHAVRPPEGLERPLWQDGPAQPPVLRSALPAHALTAELAPHPLDASWVGMTLPSLHPIGSARESAEFQGLLYLCAPYFRSAGHIAAPGIVAWDGQQFVSAGDPGMSVESIVVGSGVLYAGGYVLGGIGNTSGKVSRWDGSTWSTVGTISSPGSSPHVSGLEVWNGDLVAVGQFTNMNGVSVVNAARFDGTSWHAMGTGLLGVVDEDVFDVQSVGTDLYVTTEFDNAWIRRWNGTDWVAVGAGLNSRVNQLTTDGTHLYATGQFSMSGPDTVGGVARWNGVKWERVGVHPGASGIAWWNGHLWASSGSQLSHFDGVNWVAVGSHPAGRLGTYGTKLVGLNSVKPVPSGDWFSGATYDGSTWTPLREPWEPGMRGLDNGTVGATVWNDRLVVAGWFRGFGTGSGVTRSTCAAMWDGTSWSTFGTQTQYGPGPFPLAVTTWGTKVAFVGTTSGFIPGGGLFRSVAIWDGSAWSVPIPGMRQEAYAAIEHAGELIVGGKFVTDDNSPSPTILNRLARWTGTGWEAVGGGVSHSNPASYATVYSLASWNGQVAAGGEFDLAGSVPVSNLGLWDGTQWSDAGGGLDGECYALEAWNGVLVAGGDFTHAGGTAASGAAYWDGAAWHAMGDEAVEVVGFAQIAGTLYGVGDFRHADGSISNTVARWTGANWAVLGSGTQPVAYGLTWIRGYQGDLYAGGNKLGFAFGQAAHGIIRLPAANTVGVEDAPLSGRIQLVASPNPGGRHSTFSFTLPQAGRARLRVFDAAGRVVATLADGDMLAGPHEVRWTSPATPGVYFAKLEAPGGEQAIVRIARTE